MKSNGLLSVLTFSEKRKGLLFLLQEEPRTLSDIKEHFDVRSPEILPRLKEMENTNLIYREDGLYYLTPIGKVAARHFEPFLKTLNAIEVNESFWKKHDLSNIPENLLDRIKDLGECKIEKDENEYIYDSHIHFLDNVTASSHFMGFSSIFLPHYPSLFLEMARKGIAVSIIVTPNVFFKLKSGHSEEINEFLEFEKTELYLADSFKIAFVATDKFFSLSLFFKNGTYDPQNDLVGFSPDALVWGEDLFNYYREKSMKIETL